MQTRSDSLTRRAFTTGGVALAASACAPAALAPAFATVMDRPAKMLLGFTAGGSTDVVARLIAAHMKDYAPSVVIDARPGASGRIALQALKASPPDGLTLTLIPGSTMFLFPSIYSKLGYEPLTDFDPIAAPCKIEFGLVVGPMVPADVNTFADFVAWCRANPGKASFGSSGPGTPQHFTGELIGRLAKFDFTHVAYRGAGPATQDILAGQIASNVSVLTNVMPYLESKQLRVLAVASASRSPFLPQTPTLVELGLKDLVVEEWFGVFGPAGLPKPVVQQLTPIIKKATEQPDLIEAYRKFALAPFWLEGDALRQRIREDTARWAEIVKTVNFKLE